MEAIRAFQELEQDLPRLSGLATNAWNWVVRLSDDVASVLEALAAHDNRWDS